MSNIVKHEITENLILINNKKATLIGPTKINVGVKNTETEIVEGKTIYNLSTQSLGNFFVLDLETGSRG